MCSKLISKLDSFFKLSTAKSTFSGSRVHYTRLPTENGLKKKRKKRFSLEDEFTIIDFGWKSSFLKLISKKQSN